MQILPVLFSSSERVNTEYTTDLTGTKAPHFCFITEGYMLKQSLISLELESKESHVPVNNPSTTYTLHKSTIYAPVAQRNTMYIILRSSSCRKKSLVSYNSLAVKQNNVFLNPFAWQYTCVWLMETRE